MNAITFECRAELKMSAEEVANNILDLHRWPEFQGYGFLPGIESAEFESKTPDMVGTRIAVKNTDGSSHVEEIVEWETNRKLVLVLKEFSRPLSRLATQFEESWTFERCGESTKVWRAFAMTPKSLFSWPCLWLISIFLKRAIERHLEQMKQE